MVGTNTATNSLGMKYSQNYAIKNITSANCQANSFLEIRTCVMTGRRQPCFHVTTAWAMDLEVIFE